MDRDKFLREIEYTLREAQNMMRALYPNFNDVPNAELFMKYTWEANKALAKIQDGDEGVWE